MIASTTRESLRLFAQVIRRRGVLLLTVVIVLQGFEQGFLALMQGNGLKPAVIFGIFMVLKFVLVNLFLMVLILAIAEQGSRKSAVGLLAQAGRLLPRYFTEWAKILPPLLLGLVVVVPGIVLMVRWCFVPVIALLEAPVEHRFLGVARRSRQLTRKRSLPMFALIAGLLGTQFVLRRTVMPPHGFFLDNPAAYAWNVLGDHLFAVIYFSILVAVYRAIIKAEKSFLKIPRSSDLDQTGAVGTGEA